MLGTKHRLCQRAVAVPQAWECFEGRSFFAGLDEDSPKHWRRLLWRPGRIHRPQVVYQALWAMAGLSAAQMGWISCSRPRLRLRGERIVPEELAHGLPVRSQCIPWPADERWPSALGRHSNETAKVGSSHLCMLIDTLQPKASARCGGIRLRAVAIEMQAGY